MRVDQQITAEVHPAANLPFELRKAVKELAVIVRSVFLHENKLSGNVSFNME